MEQLTHLDHSLKKKFRTTIFCLLKDFKTQGKLNPNRITRIRKHIEHYSTVDGYFVQRTIVAYEQKIGVLIKDISKEGNNA